MTYKETDVIIIRGAPGSGKSETAKCLAARFKKGVRLEVDTLRAMVVSVDWSNQEEHVNILSLATNLVAGFIKNGYKPVIVIDTFSGNKLSNFLSELQLLNSNLEVYSFALVTTPEVLSTRVENRSADKFKNIDICQMINSDVTKYLLPEENLIDSTILTPEAIADVILEQIKAD